MGKPQRKNNQSQQQPKQGKKKPQISKMNSSDDEEVADVMAWGRKKENYYREDQDQYSQLSEEEQQAKKIYQNQYDNYLNDEDLYDIPAEKKKEIQNDGSSQKASFQAQFTQDLSQEENLPVEYVRQQLQWVLQLFKDLEFYQQDSLFKIYEQLLKSYLTVIISIKELKIPYIQYHPIVPMAVDIKTKISKLMKKLALKQESEEQSQPIKPKNNKKTKIIEEEQNSQLSEQLDEQDEQFDQKYSDEESQEIQKQVPIKSKNNPNVDHCSQAMKTQQDQHKKGLQFYNEMKKALEQQKKQKKKKQKKQKDQNQRPIFKKVNQNQGRFASQLILKNKGLIKKRKKIEGNSRVKLRMKYQKKKAIHRAQSGHLIRQNPGRAYEGESNIRYGKLAGVRLK